MVEGSYREQHEKLTLTPLPSSSQAVIRDGARCGQNVLKDRNLQWTGTSDYSTNNLKFHRTKSEQTCLS